MTDTTPEVIGFGQCSLDILGQVDKYPELDQKAELTSLLVQGGGPVATAMVTLARLGVPVAFAGAVGDDEFGTKIRAGLQAEQVDCEYLATVPGTSSQVAFISVDGNGHRNIFWHRGTAEPVLPDAMHALLSHGVRLLHLDGLHLAAAIRAARMARAHGVTTVLDAGTWRPGVEQLLPLIDHLVVSQKFAYQSIGKDDPYAALAQLSGYGARAVTITMGAAGSLSRESDGEVFQQRAFKVDAVDTTGCGDVYHGGYIYGLLKGWPLRKTVRFAAACSALKARDLGGRTAIPSLAEVTEFLASATERS